MKKFIVFALCAISACSVFAEPYSKAKANELYKAKNNQQLKKYCYESEVSSETDYNQALYDISYFYWDITKCKFTKEQLFQRTNKYNGKITDSQRLFLEANYLALGGFDEDAKKLMVGFNESLQQGIYYHMFNNAMQNKNKEKIWQYGKKILLINGGYENANYATNIINKMFRYKSESITKEQQIELLSKLSQIYPIPGTDFNKWKGFMGFLGFKYKQLTKKDLY